MIINSNENIKKENLQELMLSFYYSTGLQIVYVNANIDIVHSIPQIPFFNPCILNNYLQDIIEHASEDIKKNYSVYKANMYEHFFYIPVVFNGNFNGALIVGPIRCTCIKYNNLDFFISTENISLSNKPKLYDYLSKLPFVDYYRIHYLAILLIKLISTPYCGTLIERNVDVNNSFPSNISDEIKSIGYYEQYSNNRELRYTHHPYYLEKEINAAIKNLDVDSVFKHFANINTYPLPDLCKGNYVRSIKNHIIIETAIFSRIAIEAGADSEIAFTLGDVLIQKLETFSDLDLIKSFWKEIYFEFYKLIKKYSLNNYSYTLTKAIQFIHHNLTSDISLNTVARNIGTNPSYLSTIFKKESGSSFSDYINARKIEEAKYLLTYSEQSILEVALYLNYSSQSYFTQVFKKIEGITPKMYREKKKEV